MHCTDSAVLNVSFYLRFNAIAGPHSSSISSNEERVAAWDGEDELKIMQEDRKRNED